MKREEVQKQIPGITKEQLDWLMAENGADINAEKQKSQSLQTDLDAARQQLQTARDGLKAFEGVDVKDLQGQIAKLKSDMTAQADAFAFDAALDGAIRDAKGRDVKAIRGMLDIDALKSSKDRTTDIKAALDTLVKDKAWAFETSSGASEEECTAQAQAILQFANPGGYPNVKDGGEPAARPTGSAREQFAGWAQQYFK